ncbi:hypothetical protein MZK49_31670, partial [Ensifer sesbaniae]|nr:hypothetical protein [Ensifer sesbaniae]
GLPMFGITSQDGRHRGDTGKPVAFDQLLGRQRRSEIQVMLTHQVEHQVAEILAVGLYFRKAASQVMKCNALVQPSRAIFMERVYPIPFSVDCRRKVANLAFKWKGLS